jgi:hypothetical protein
MGRWGKVAAGDAGATGIQHSPYGTVTGRKNEKTKIRPAVQSQPGGAKNQSALFLAEMLGVLLVELLDPAGGIDQFLLAGEKGMAGGTDFHLDLLVNGAELNLVAAGALGLDLVIGGMDISFHG